MKHAHQQEELVEVLVSKPFVRVTDINSNKIQAQVTPFWSWHKNIPTSATIPQASTTKFRLLFKVKVPPLGLSTYLIHSTKPGELQT